MVKRAIISAAGRGTRMKHLSADRPKHMIEVNGEPFLYYLLSNLEDVGFEDIIIVVGHKADHIIEYVKRGRHKNVRIINQFERIGEEKYGTAIPLLAAQDELDGEDFVAVYGDNLYSVRDLKMFTEDDGYHHLAGFEVPDPSRYGVLVMDENRFLKEIIEKPQTDVGSKIINTGLMHFKPDVFDELAKVKPNTINGEYYLTDALTELGKKKKIRVHILKDYWLDFGKPEDVQTLSTFLNERSVA